MIHDLFGSPLVHLCSAISFLSHLAEFLSASLTVLFTIQRYTAVRYPLQAAVQRHSSPLTSLFVILLSSLLFCLALSYSNVHIECHEELQLRWFIADALLSFIIPFTLILIFNVLIINLIRIHARSPLRMWKNAARQRADDLPARETYPMAHSSSPSQCSRLGRVRNNHRPDPSPTNKNNRRARAPSSQTVETDLQTNELTRVGIRDRVRALKLDLQRDSWNEQVRQARISRRHQLRYASGVVIFVV